VGAYLVDALRVAWTMREDHAFRFDQDKTDGRVRLRVRQRASTMLSSDGCRRGQWLTFGDEAAFANLNIEAELHAARRFV
jgi:hypothetical protein